MAKPIKSKIYDEVVYIYSHLMRKVHYDYWADYIYSITNRYTDHNSKVLEIACGNCQLAQFLSDYYPNYFASDLSLPMLRQSKNMPHNKICCNMIRLPFKGKFDLVISAFDSINYLIVPKEIILLFDEVSRILTNNGIFTFDVSLESNSFKHIRDANRKSSFNGIKYLQKSSYNPKTRIHKNYFLITRNNGQIFEEMHIQKIYPLKTYFKLLDKANLQVLECYDAFTCKSASEKSSRVQFLVRKK